MHVSEQLNCFLKYIFCCDGVRRLYHVRPNIDCLVTIFLTDVLYFVISSVRAAKIGVEMLPT
jgi:hypothetical protein